jgi:hypothetical protein
MGNRIAEMSGALVAAAMMLTLLVVLSGGLLLILILLFVVRALLRGQARAVAEEPVQAVGLFGAPASPWWLDQYDRWLWRVEDVLKVNLTQSPARLFAGSMILAGIGGSLLAGAGYLLVGPETFWPVLGVAVVINGLSAYWLSRPMTAMFEPFSGGGSAGSPGRANGVVIGEPLDWGG